MSDLRPKNLDIGKFETKEGIPAVERPGTPEKGRERESRSAENRERKEVLEDLRRLEEAPGAGVVQATNRQQRIKEREKKVERTLESGLEEIYIGLDPEKQREFRTKGEETAEKINSLLDSAKLKFKTVVELIRKWLLIIPGLNKFFLEKEAKIKADEILKLRE